MDIQFFTGLIQNFGYFGAFLVGLLSSVTIFLPTPAFLVIFALSAPGLGFNPGLLGLCGGIGAAIGELTGYLVGYGGREFLLKKYEKTEI